MDNKYKNIQISIAYDENRNDILIDNALKDKIYRCYDCNDILIVKNGKKIAKHYAHKSLNTCNGESWQHIFCKKIIGKYLNNLKFKSDCNNCKKRTIKTFVNNIPKEEYAYNNFKIDVGILDEENELKGCIEIFHTHKTEESKCKNIVFNQFKYFEVKTKELISKYKEIKEGKTSIMCENTELCLHCDNLEINMKTLITKFMIKYLDYFKYINICKEIIEISKGKLYDKLKKMLQKHIKDIKKEDMDNNKIAGLFLTQIFKKTFNKIQKKKYKKYMDNNKFEIDEDINIYKFDLNSSFMHNEIIKNDTYSIIKTPFKTVKDLFESDNFNIPCIQIVFCEDKFYLTSKALYSLVTDINIMNKNDDINNIKLLCEYVSDNDVITKNINMINKNKNENLKRRFFPTGNLIVCNIMNINNEIKEIREIINHVNNKKCNRTFYKQIEKNGSKCHDMLNKYNKKWEKIWYIPITTSLMNFKNIKYRGYSIDYSLENRKILDLKNKCEIKKFLIKKDLNMYDNVINLLTINNPIYLLIILNEMVNKIYGSFEKLIENNVITDDEFNKLLKYSLFNKDDLKDFDNIETMSEFKKDMYLNKDICKIINWINQKYMMKKVEDKNFVFLFNDNINFSNLDDCKKYYGVKKCNKCDNKISLIDKDLYLNKLCKLCTNKNNAILKLKEWFKGGGITPLKFTSSRYSGIFENYPICKFKDNNSSYINNSWEIVWDELVDHSGTEYIPSYDDCVKYYSKPIDVIDIVCDHKGNPAFGIILSNDIIPKQRIQKLKRNNIENIYTISINWILSKYNTPTEIECTRIT